ncbi:MAG: putative toxin-antitoxin system toxin component, PIN family [Proteobacteria bacterium]|nr:putative toxin-antitoxin system toxin component, PIN family [Pseudomonadota bacterium]
MVAVPRVVLDTNVCLDLWLFGDPRAAGLRAALHAGGVLAVTDQACREEWLRVLHYPQLRLTDEARAALAGQFDALVLQLPSTASSDLRTLPRCADPDDQKFLELAHASGARWLVSRDGAVLALARRALREGLFEIVPPQAWTPTALTPPPH